MQIDGVRGYIVQIVQGLGLHSSIFHTVGRGIFNADNLISY